jgi:hypothetical protein
MEPTQFGSAAQVAYPQTLLPQIDFPVDTQGIASPEEGL